VAKVVIVSRFKLTVVEELEFSVLMARAACAVTYFHVLVKVNESLIDIQLLRVEAIKHLISGCKHASEVGDTIEILFELVHGVCSVHLSQGI